MNLKIPAAISEMADVDSDESSGALMNFSMYSLDMSRKKGRLP
jgi:hypothetical protein